VPSKGAPRVFPLRVLKPVVCTVVPEAAALNETRWQNLEIVIASTVNSRPPALVRQLRLFVYAIEWCPVVRYGKPFSALPSEDRERVFRYLENHRIQIVRVAFWGLRSLAMLGFYCQPECAQEIGYRPDVRGWNALR
jgi:hypothetical protein